MIADKPLTIEQILFIIKRLDELTIEQLKMFDKICTAGYIRLDLNDFEQVSCLTTLAIRQVSQGGVHDLQRYNIVSNVVLNLFKFATPLQVA